jgi:hypothetical protein
MALWRKENPVEARHPDRPLAPVLLRMSGPREPVVACRVAALVLLALSLAPLACSRFQEDGPSSRRLSVRVIARGEIELTWTPRGRMEAPEVRYATSPLTVETWEAARTVGSWTPADGGARLRSVVGRLPPVLHHVAVGSGEGGTRSISERTSVLPLRETILHGALARSYFGYSVALVGDVNGDGFGDFLVGAPWSEQGLEEGRRPYLRWMRGFLRRIGLPLHGASSGAAYLYPGRAGGAATAPVWTLFGKVEGDLLGSAVAGAGDVNGDGYADVAVGIPGHDAELRNEGALAVFYGRRGFPASEPDLLLVGRTRDESLGSAIAAGDFNRDGYADLAVGAPGSNLGATNGGAVFVFYGDPRGLGSRPGTALIGKTVDGLFGSALAAVGDVNGDGYEDLVVGAYEGVADPTAAGAAYLYYGGPKGLSSAPGLVLRGRTGGEQFGSALGALGDVNGDGFADFAVGARKNGDAGEEAGAVYIYHGSRSGPAATPRVVLRGPAPHAQFGAALSGVADLNVDGFADLLVGAFQAGKSEEGAVLLYLGSPDGIREPAAFTLRGRHAGAHFGKAIAGGRDVDGDGQPDFLVGAEGDAGRGDRAGAVFVRY